MSAVIWEPQTWAEEEFSACKLGDRRRNQRLIKLAIQAAARPDGSTPDQTESWADLKGAYRLFDSDDIAFQDIIQPHCLRTRASCVASDVKLIFNDTTELNYTSHCAATGLGSVARGGKQKGFFLHTGLMLDAGTEMIDGLAGQELFHRPFPNKSKKPAKNTRRRDPKRESMVWGRLFERIGPPPEGVKWVHVCDRGADDYEVILRAIQQRCSFVIRAAKLHRKILTLDGRTLELAQVLDEWKSRGERDVRVPATAQQASRKANCELRWGEVLLPKPRVTNAWIREHAPAEPLRIRVVELREKNPPANAKPIRWVQFTLEEVADVPAAERVIHYYELRWTIEDYHKCLKTGCQVESRRYETAARLERVVGLLSVVAIRLLRMRTAAKETPERPAREVAPQGWIEMLKAERKLSAASEPTIRQFVRALGSLGGHLGRKHDGQPGWITLWRGYEKLQLLMRGYRVGKKCG